MFTTVYTRTHNTSPRRFLDSDSIVWASLKPSYNEYDVDEFGEVLWKLEVCLPNSHKGDFLFSGQEVPSSWVWGNEGEWMCFKSEMIISKQQI